MDFQEFDAKVSDYCRGKNYPETISLLTKAEKLLPQDVYFEREFSLLLQLARLYMQIGEHISGRTVLATMIEKGYSCPLHYSIFEPLFEDIDYLKLKRQNAILRAKQQETARFTYEVYLPDGYSDKKHPVFFNLHGDGDDINAHKAYWKPDSLLERGFIVVYPQASQVLYHNAYAWCKRLFNAERIEECTGKYALYNGNVSRGCYDLAHHEMRECYEEIRGKYRLDEARIYIGGMSGGATAALEFTMADLFPIKGFVALCPELQPSSFSKNTVELACRRGVRGVFMEGEHARYVEDEGRMLQMFREVGLPCPSVINKGIGHWFPDDLDAKVERAIAFIEGADWTD